MVDMPVTEEDHTGDVITRSVLKSLSSLEPGSDVSHDMLSSWPVLVLERC